MSSQSLLKKGEFFPSFIGDIFKPWNGWPEYRFDKILSVPAVNVTENEKEYKISVAAPGLKKTDFKIDVKDNVLTIAAESEKNKEVSEENFTRQEYNFSAFSRSFTLPENASEDNISATYDGGVLQLLLPKNSSVSKPSAKTIAVN
jgi:HSP20 family protein